MASISKRPDGRYRARYRDPDGREHARHFRRKTDAQGWLDRQAASIVTGTHVDPKAGKITFGAYAEAWRAAQVYRPSTAEVVERALKRRVYPALGGKPLESIRPADVQKLVADLSAGLAPATVTVTYSYVATVFKDAVRNRRLARTPCEGITLPKVEKRRVQPLSTEQVLTIAEAMPDSLSALVIVTAGTGMRQGEVFGLTLDRVRFLERGVIVDRQMVGVRGRAPVFGPPKTQSSVREIPLPSSVADALARHIERFPPGRDGLLFVGATGEVLRRSSFGEVWRRTVKNVGLPGVVFHELRHYYASLLIRYGESVKTVQSRLGHKSAGETLNTYAHLWPDSDDRTREAIDAALADPADFLRTNRPDEPSNPNKTRG